MGDTYEVVCELKRALEFLDRMKPGMDVYDAAMEWYRYWRDTSCRSEGREKSLYDACRAAEEVERG